MEGSAGTDPLSARPRPPGPLGPPAAPHPVPAQSDETSALLGKSDVAPVRPSRSNHCLLFVLVLLSALGGFLFGYDTGIVSGAMVLVRDDLDISPVQHETVVSATVFTAILGSALSAP